MIVLGVKTKSLSIEHKVFHTLTQLPVQPRSLDRLCSVCDVWFLPTYATFSKTLSSPWILVSGQWVRMRRTPVPWAGPFLDCVNAVSSTR